MDQVEMGSNISGLSVEQTICLYVCTTICVFVGLVFGLLLQSRKYWIRYEIILKKICGISLTDKIVGNNGLRIFYTSSYFY